MTQLTSSYQNRLTATDPLIQTLPKWAQRFTINSLGSIEALKNEAYYLRQQLQQAQEQLNHHHNTSQDIHNRLGQYQDEVKRQQERIEAMESSKFWKIRSHWFNLKRKVGLPAEE